MKFFTLGDPWEGAAGHPKGSLVSGVGTSNAIQIAGTPQYRQCQAVPPPPSPIPGVAPKKCGPRPLGIRHPGGPLFWTKSIVEPKSDLGSMVKMEVKIPFL